MPCDVSGGAAHPVPARLGCRRKKPDADAMSRDPWRIEPDGVLVSDVGEFRLVVKQMGGWMRYLVLRRPAGIGVGAQVLLASGTENDARAAMAASTTLAPTSA